MNKKAFMIIAIIAIAVLGLGGYFLFNNTAKSNETEKTPNNPAVGDNTDVDNKEEPSSNRKTLVVYYSASGSTKKVAEEIVKNLNADLFEIVPEDVYTTDDLDWTNENSRVSREHDDESLRNVKFKNTKVDNWESYDTVLIGYPIWWGQSHYVRQNESLLV